MIRNPKKRFILISTTKSVSGCHCVLKYHTGFFITAPTNATNSFLDISLLELKNSCVPEADIHIKFSESRTTCKDVNDAQHRRFVAFEPLVNCALLFDQHQRNNNCERPRNTSRLYVRTNHDLQPRI